MPKSDEFQAVVMVIDDERIIHSTVSRTLEEENIKVMGAFSVDEAIGLLDKRPFDLVLVDLMMPGKSGMEAVEFISKYYPHIGVIMFTGYPSVSSTVESMKLGSLDYLPKPFTPEQLIDVTKSGLKKVFKARRDREIEDTYEEAEKALTSSLDLKSILKLICSSMIKIFKLKGASIYLFKGKNRELVLAQSQGLSKEYMEKGAIEASRSIPDTWENRELLIIDREQFYEKLQYPDQAKNEGIQRIVSVPMEIKGQNIGCVRAYFSDQSPLGGDELELMEKFSTQCALAMDKAMAFERMKTDLERLKNYR